MLVFLLTPAYLPPDDKNVTATSIAPAKQPIAWNRVMTAMQIPRIRLGARPKVITEPKENEIILGLC